MSPSSNLQFVNLAFYKFVTLSNWQAVKKELEQLVSKFCLRGTILLSEEGINSCVVGTRANTHKFVIQMKTNPVLACFFKNIDFKESLSPEIPFSRMYVKYRSEIVTMGKPGISPEHFTGKYVEPLELKSWIDNQEDFILVDTRNDYELRLGSFDGALDPNIKTFREFPEWLLNNTDKIPKEKKIVTFCTGGIRCEKATAFMRQQGFSEVYQLHGGILKYLEETKTESLQNKVDNNNHFNGDCFVFDYRVAVNKNLEKTGALLCYSCRAPLTENDVQSELYVFNEQCPYCAE
jgi:UPF0176 protein